MDWNQKYREHSPGIYQYLLNLCGNKQEAEDLLQETFIKAMRSEKSLRDESKMRSWLMTISRNLFLDNARKNSRWRAAGYGGDEDEFSMVPDNGVSPEHSAESADFMTSMQAALKTLVESHRTAFVLGVIQRLSYQEIENITGWSTAMVKTNIFRARKKMAEALAEYR